MSEPSKSALDRANKLVVEWEHEWPRVSYNNLILSQPLGDLIQRIARALDATPAQDHAACARIVGRVIRPPLSFNDDSESAASCVNCGRPVSEHDTLPGDATVPFCVPSPPAGVEMALDAWHDQREHSRADLLATVSALIEAQHERTRDRCAVIGHMYGGISVAKKIRQEPRP